MTTFQKISFWLIILVILFCCQTTSYSQRDSLNKMNDSLMILPSIEVTYSNEKNRWTTYKEGLVCGKQEEVPIYEADSPENITVSIKNAGDCDIEVSVTKPIPIVGKIELKKNEGTGLKKWDGVSKITVKCFGQDTDGKCKVTIEIK